MGERVFLGWDRPFLQRASEWLVAHRTSLLGQLMVVPTSQAGRALREAMTASAGALLMPEITTPGALLKTENPAVAPDWMEQLAWIETLETIDDWSIYQELFPIPPNGQTTWSTNLAHELVALRHTLQENGHSLTTAARCLSKSIESARWHALGGLEIRMEKLLRAWGRDSRSATLANGLRIPNHIHGVILVGTTDMPPLVERSLLEWNLPITVLIGAPPSEADHFSPIGRPLPSWTERIMPWPEGSTGSVILAADPRQQAVEALNIVAQQQTPSNDVALGTADSTCGHLIAEQFCRAGWPAFHPASTLPTSGLVRWLTVWSTWLANPTLAIAADLFTLPESNNLIKESRAAAAESLAQLRNDWLMTYPDDLRQRIQHGNFRSASHQTTAITTLTAVESLEQWRHTFLTNDFTTAINSLIAALTTNSEETTEQAIPIQAWLTDAALMIKSLDRPPVFWIDLMLSHLPTPSPKPPDNRVIDVQGWLELFFEPGNHLVICSLNEGHVPDRNSGDPWIGEAAAKPLGLIGNIGRAARDAFLYHAMIEARRSNGRVDLICLKSGTGGEALLPSRLLLAAPRDALPERVRFLFRSIEPPDAGMRWHADWKWQPRTAMTKPEMAVTSLGSYLACPFRFYLKHVLHMQTHEPNRREWNARDFGNIAHEVLEYWGRDPDAHQLIHANQLAEWFSNKLDEIVARAFSSHPPLAIKIQTEAMRQRLAWFANVQAQETAAGWSVIAVEQKCHIPIGDSTIIARIDRIDRHRESGQLRVIDYKTGKPTPPDAAHRKKISSLTQLPAHLDPQGPAIFSSLDAKGKPADFRWINLQLPLYVAGLKHQQHTTATPCYVHLGATEADVRIAPWDDFSESDLQSAVACATWVVEQINNQVFWPPAEKVEHDEFETLATDRTFEEMFSPPSTARSS